MPSPHEEAGDGANISLAADPGQGDVLVSDQPVIGRVGIDPTEGRAPN